MEKEKCKMEEAKDRKANSKKSIVASLERRIEARDEYIAKLEHTIFLLRDIITDALRK